MDDAILPGAIGSGRLSIPWYPAYWRGQRDLDAPDLLVLHSASIGDDPARWIHDPVWRETPQLAQAALDGVARVGSLRLCTDGLWRRIGAAHIAARSRDGGFVQMEDLGRESPHAGGSVFQGRGRVNQRSLGIELPAHAGPALLDAFRAVITELVQVMPSLEYWTLHRWIRRGKSDPICWSDDQCRAAMVGIGLVEG